MYFSITRGIFFSIDNIYNIDVPQGSILGLLIFLIYANHLKKEINFGYLAQCANDTSIIISLSAYSTESEKITHDVFLMHGKYTCTEFREGINDRILVTTNGDLFRKVNQIVFFCGIYFDNNLNFSIY